jgi:phosphate uptake regulator
MTTESRRANPAREPTPPAPVETRARFHHDLEALEERMRDMADCARRALERSVQALADSDLALAASVFAGDDDLEAGP